MQRLSQAAAAAAVADTVRPFGMRSAAVAGRLCRLSTNRAVLSVLCPYKVMPRDRRKVAADRANPSFGGGVRNHRRPVPAAARLQSTDRHGYRPRAPGPGGLARQDAHRPRTAQPF